MNKGSVKKINNVSYLAILFAQLSWIPNGVSFVLEDGEFPPKLLDEINYAAMALLNFGVMLYAASAVLFEGTPEPELRANSSNQAPNWRVTPVNNADIAMHLAFMVPAIMIMSEMDTESGDIPHTLFAMLYVFWAASARDLMTSVPGNDMQQQFRLLTAVSSLVAGVASGLLAAQSFVESDLIYPTGAAGITAGTMFAVNTVYMGWGLFRPPEVSYGSVGVDPVVGEDEDDDDDEIDSDDDSNPVGTVAAVHVGGGPNG